MRESRSYGSVGEQGGNELLYPDRIFQAVLLLKQLAAYVELVANDDNAMLLSSGFALTKDSAPAGPLGQAQNFRVEAVDKSQLKLSCDANKLAKVYQMEYRLVTDTEWTEVLSSSSRFLLTGLQSGKEYVCRALLVGTSLVRTYSGEVNCFVL